jgi:hypothetical protein
MWVRNYNLNACAMLVPASSQLCVLEHTVNYVDLTYTQIYGQYASTSLLIETVVARLLEAALYELSFV